MSQSDQRTGAFLAHAQRILGRLLEALDQQDPRAVGEVREMLGRAVAPRLIVNVEDATVVLAFTEGDLTVECLHAPLSRSGDDAPGIDGGESPIVAPRAALPVA